MFSCSLWPTLGQKATETKEQWKELKATYMDHVDVIKCALSEALPQVKEAHRKYTELQKAFEQLEAKVIPRELVGRKDRRRKG